jgi:hypothetical protein
MPKEEQKHEQMDIEGSQKRIFRLLPPLEPEALENSDNGDF